MCEFRDVECCAGGDGDVIFVEQRDCSGGLVGGGVAHSFGEGWIMA